MNAITALKIKLVNVQNLLRQIGFENTVRTKIFRFLTWKLKKNKNLLPPPIHRQNIKSIMTGVENDYLNVVRLINNSNKYYKKFRRSSTFSHGIEGISVKLAQEYQNELLRVNSDFFNFPDIRKFDSVGKPFKYKIAKTRSSCIAFRYLKVLSDLQIFFGKLDNKVIYELGAGYGGQAYFISKFYKLRKYLICDLFEVNNLIKRNIVNWQLPDIFEFYNKPDYIEPDIFISNYAFSELSGDLQLDYLQNVIKNAKMGYITWNNLALESNSLKGMELDEICSYVRKPHLIEESPSSFEGNKIIWWRN